METKPIQKPISAAEITAMNGIVLEKPESMVKQITIYLKEISRNGNEVTLTGVKTISGGEAITVKTSLRSIQYLNTKSVKRISPFSKTEFKRFFEQKEGTPAPLKTAYTFFVNVLTHNETQTGYAITFKKLVALNSQIFNAYLKGETPKSHKELFPFNLGETEVITKNGNIKVNFGYLNGNSGIKVLLPSGVKLGLSYKHLPNSVYGMCQNLNAILKNEGIQKAKTEIEAAGILETFKGNTM